MALRPLRLPPIFRDVYHWALFLQHVSGPKGDLYHTRRDQGDHSGYEEVAGPDINPATQPSNTEVIQPDTSVQDHRRCAGCSPFVSGYGDGYGIDRDIHPLRTQGKKLYMGIAVSNNVGAEILDETCRRVNMLHPYSVLGNNCQHFSLRVLRQVVWESVMTMAEFDHAWDASYHPISARWKVIRDQPDLRLLQQSNCVTSNRDDVTCTEGME